ncbi:hypothetical protein [Kitasatospora griseola]|uniref:hypothetical protein n=1 Tax=Kitasatospora griseola TaxID=2064 RepID=UPI00166FA314|nr:hypothetical protein [Kitasatospora griseola]GGQ69821.1 hypothetical protein GCM10010195_26710 [Kitasatospora griseola]
MNARTIASAPALRFPLPKRHRRMLACAAVAASVVLGSFGVAVTVETVRQGHAVSAAQR